MVVELQQAARRAVYQVGAFAVAIDIKHDAVSVVADFEVLGFVVFI